MSRVLPVIANVVVRWAGHLFLVDVAGCAPLPARPAPWRKREEACGAVPALASVHGVIIRRRPVGWDTMQVHCWQPVQVPIERTQCVHCAKGYCCAQDHSISLVHR